MASISQSTQNFTSNKKMLLDMREEAYNKQKDMRKHIEIRVSELMDKESPHTEDDRPTEDSFVKRNDHPNVSVKILEEYQLKQMPKKPLGNSRSRDKIKSLSSVGTLGSEQQQDHRIGDLFKWQDRIKKKHEMQREFQEQIRSSMYDYKVYTNDLSNQMLETIRPNAKVENILLAKGKAKEIKVKKIEQQLYGGDRVPAITKMAQKMQHTNHQNVYSRLYDYDKPRRDKSRETLSRNQSQIDHLDTRKRSKSEGKGKNGFSAHMSPQRGQTFEFGFSPREMTSPISVNPKTQTGRENTLSLQQTVATSPTGFMSPLYSVKNAKMTKEELNKSNEEIFSPFYPSPVNTKHKAVPQQKNGPISIYKRLTPAPNNNTTPGNRSLQMSKQNTSENIQKSAINNTVAESVNQQQNINQDQPQKVKKTLGMGPSESTPVLPNMLFFKNTDRKQSSTPTQMNHQNIQAPRDNNVLRGLESNQKELFDIRSMEVFWEKILQDDSAGIKKGFEMNGKKYDAYQDHEGYQNVQPRVSLADRGKMWVEKKNKKLDNQRKQKEQQELDACTFKPQMQTQDQMSKNQQMYYNFLERIAKSNSSSSGTVSPLYPPPQSSSGSRKNGQQLQIQTGNNLDVLTQENLQALDNVNNARYSGDTKLQKKIYNYILNIPPN